MAGFAGSINASTSGGNVSYTNVGFPPKLLLLWGVNLTTPGENDSTGWQMSFGMSDGTDAYCWQMAYGSGSSPRRAGQDTSVYRLIDTSGAVVAEAEIVSFDADGFTLNWTTTAAAGFDINIVAVGGADISNAKLITGDLTGTGDAVLTGAGFTPEHGVVMSFDSTTVPTIVEARENPQIGAFDGTRQGSIGWVTASALTNSLAGTRSIVDTIFTRTLAVGGSDQIIAALKTLDADGITLDVTTHSGEDTHVAALVWAGGDFHVDNYDTPTSTGNSPRTGVGFQPDVILALNQDGLGLDGGSPRGLNVNDAPGSIGAFDGTRQRRTLHGANGTLSGAGVGYSESDMQRVTTEGQNPSSSAVSVGVGVSLDSDGHTINYTTASASDEMLMLSFRGGVATSNFDNKIIFADGITTV